MPDLADSHADSHTVPTDAPAWPSLAIPPNTLTTPDHA